MIQGVNRRALLDQLGGNTGVAGNSAEIAETRGMAAPSLQVPAATIAPGEGPASEHPAEIPIANVMPPAPNYGAVGQYGNRLEGFDATKLNGDHDSAKYQIGRALSNFDPRGGVTGDVLGALNGLGIGTFSGQGDKLHVTGGSHGLQGDTDLDVVRGLKDPNGTGGWQYGVEGDDITRQGSAGGAAAAASGGQNTGLAMAQSNLNGLMQGSPYANIQQALGQLEQPNLKALLAQLGAQ